VVPRRVRTKLGPENIIRRFWMYTQKEKEEKETDRM